MYRPLLDSWALPLPTSQTWKQGGDIVHVLRFCKPKIYHSTYVHKAWSNSPRLCIDGVDA